MGESIWYWCVFFFFNDTATTEIYTLSLHDALPIYGTPADLLCGKNLRWDNGVKFGAGDRSVKSLCSSFFRTEWDLLPVLDENKVEAFLKTQNDTSGVALIPWCNFIKSACMNPIKNSGLLKKNLGQIVDRIFTQSCDWLGADISKEQDIHIGCNISLTEENTTLINDPWKRNGCRACRDVKRALLDVVMRLNPASESVTNAILALASVIVNPNGIRVKDIVTAIPLGVIKPFKAGEATLLYESSNQTKNDLNEKIIRFIGIPVSGS